MDKVQKRGFIKYNTPSSEPFRIERPEELINLLGLKYVPIEIRLQDLLR
jgi:hypothetical protein